ncbi:MAG TPA: methylated-DNA--[protein]-cysteine S-methyltransferase [Burkholderiaceae bacterium]|nr:methylated-DNA--[protein]-cysteine S-methyltransferase [Burkholderiaceae bacterium]
MEPTTPPHFALFDTPLGACGVLWRGDALIGVLLPGDTAVATRARARRRHAEATESAPPPFVQAAIARIVALLNGAHDDLTDLALDMSGIAKFERRVYEAARAIAPGCTRTYGELAEQLGEPHAARAVGQALGANPFAIVVPCHRVLAAHGRSGGFSAPGGTRTKLRLLEIERAPLGGSPGLFDA